MKKVEFSADQDGFNRSTLISFEAKYRTSRHLRRTMPLITSKDHSIFSGVPMRILSHFLAVLFLCVAPASYAAADDFSYAEIKTNKGLIILELNTTKAPISVANFEKYANDGYYTNTIFHRVIGTFMIQGGGFDFHGKYPAGLHQKPGTRAPIKNEWENGLKNVRGSVAMARTNDPDSATSQFFINVVDNAMLDQPRGGAAYAVFGRVIAGMDTVDTIKNVATMRLPNGMGDVPSEEIMILSVKIVDKATAESAESRIAEGDIKRIEAEIARLKLELEVAKKKAALMKKTK